MSQAYTEKLLDYKISQTRGPGWDTSQKMVKYDLWFHLFPTLAPLSHRPKSTRIITIYISTWKSSQSEGRFTTIWINNLGNLPLDTMHFCILVCAILTNSIYSNPIPHMMVSFILVPLHWKSQFKFREWKRGQVATTKFQAQRKE